VSGCPLKEADRNLVYENKVLGVPRYVRKNSSFYEAEGLMTHNLFSTECAEKPTLSFFFGLSINK
jgi:hypothetical protein